MNAYDTGDICGDVCTDCAMAITNGDTSGISDYDAWSARVDSVDNSGYRVVVTSYETHFSKSWCDYCHTQFAGDRHDVVFVPC